MTPNIAASLEAIAEEMHQKGKGGPEQDYCWPWRDKLRELAAAIRSRDAAIAEATADLTLIAATCPFPNITDKLMDVRARLLGEAPRG